MSNQTDTLAEQLKELSFFDMMKVVAAGLLGYAGYRITKRFTESEEE